MYIVQYTVYSVLACNVLTCGVHCTLYGVHCTPVHCTPVHCTPVHCTLYSVQCTPYIVLSTSHIVHLIFHYLHIVTNLWTESLDAELITLFGDSLSLSGKDITCVEDLTSATSVTSKDELAAHPIVSRSVFLCVGNLSASS